jgi:hypothetical protein
MKLKKTKPAARKRARQAKLVQPPQAPAAQHQQRFDQLLDDAIFGAKKQR